MYTSVFGKVVDDDDYQTKTDRAAGCLRGELDQGRGWSGLQLWTVWHLGFDPVGGGSGVGDLFVKFLGVRRWGDVSNSNCNSVIAALFSRTHPPPPTSQILSPLK